jgi:hypothetical protein
MRLYTAFIALFVFCAPITRASDDEFSRRSLRGFRTIQVVIDAPPPEAEQAGLTKSAIQTDVELKLRQAGIRVLDQTTDVPWLHVAVFVIPSSDSNWPYAIEVELCQGVTLTRDPSISLIGTPTWSVGGYGSVGRQNVRSLREDVKDAVDKFINAYLAVNPKN